MGRTERSSIRSRHHHSLHEMAVPLYTVSSRGQRRPSELACSATEGASATQEAPSRNHGDTHPSGPGPARRWLEGSTVWQ